MEVCCTLAVFLAILCLASTTEQTHKRFEYKYSFKGPYLAQKDNQVPFWQYSGSEYSTGASLLLTKESTTYVIL